MKDEDIYRIAWDDYLLALEGNISQETLGKVKDELLKQNNTIPNLLKDEKKRVVYDRQNVRQHALIVNPSHKITVMRIRNEEI